MRTLALMALVGCGGRGGDFEIEFSPENPLARDITISKIGFNQGVDHIVVDRRYGEPFGQPSIIHDRAGVMRVHVNIDESTWEEREIIAILDFEGVRGPARFVHSMFVEGDSFEAEPETTFDFDVPPDLAHEGSFFTVTLHETDASDPGDDSNTEARFDLMDNPWTGIDTGELTIRIIPIAYGGDGSNRLPDTSPAQVAAIADSMRGMYPATSVRVEVAPALPWSPRLTAGGGGWPTLLAEIADQRAAADVPPNTYFYGLFSPAETDGEFCSGGGCVLGLSNFGEVGDISTRSSIGVGWNGELAVDTLVHEIGHAHGREHSPCGQGVSGVDPGYPHSSANLGTWGWDINTGDLIAPTVNKDMMSYCSPIWVSDYTWFHLSERIAALAQPDLDRSLEVLHPFQRYAIELDGSLVPVGPVRMLPTPDGGERVTVSVDGSDVEATRFRASHIDAGMLLVPVEPRFDAKKSAIRLP